MTNEKLLQLQFALFFTTNENRPDKLITKVDNAFGELFDQMPNMINLPSDAPLELPRITMQSSDGIYACNIGINRIDFIGHYIDSGSSVTVNVQDFIKKVYLLSSEIFADREIIRFGLVGQYFIESASAVEKITTKYLNIDIENLEEINIRFNKNFINGGLTMNDVVEISKGSVTIANISQKDGILIQRDINNKPTKVLEFNEMKSIIESNESKLLLSGIRELI
ncbi:hypothetical protein CSV80_15650 [Sporosarcina sp. P12(2017)]|uniref:hypothetical protein n=1 Tax=unclassified Sporosarcina TaxID=2647733 RepID=UPI000C170E0D|nr:MULTISPECIES: hypothetical protein [unclassified Sporosarcina]PIC56263.1 hypothetical protein CSV81_15230 [Sporosarcina sp. P10]PIC59507.1 hypothetical protein CSV80_15650 [Sporosarcina sp. P12(2017)]